MQANISQHFRFLHYDVITSMRDTPAPASRRPPWMQLGLGSRRGTVGAEAPAEARVVVHGEAAPDAHEAPDGQRTAEVNLRPGGAASSSAPHAILTLFTESLHLLFIESICPN